MQQWANGQKTDQHFYALDLPASTVRGLFDQSGAVTQRYGYGPFGEPQPASGTTGNPLRFAARELDATAGLYYVRARWYDASMGRFISEDPIGLAGGINNYAYAANDPVNLRDPTGLSPCGVEQIGLMIIITSTVGGCDEGDWYDGFYERLTDQTFSLLGGQNQECTRSILGNRFSPCESQNVPENRWDDVRARIESISIGIPECAGAKAALLDLWIQGREAGGIKFWSGRDYQYNPDGSPKYIRPGWRATVFGTHDGTRVLYEGAEFWRNPRLPVHEGLHRYLYLRGDLRNNETYIHSVDRLCPATR